MSRLGDNNLEGVAGRDLINLTMDVNNDQVRASINLNQSYHGAESVRLPTGGNQSMNESHFGSIHASEVHEVNEGLKSMHTMGSSKLSQPEGAEDIGHLMSKVKAQNEEKKEKERKQQEVDMNEAIMAATAKDQAANSTAKKASEGDQTNRNAGGGWLAKIRQEQLAREERVKKEKEERNRRLKAILDSDSDDN